MVIARLENEKITTIKTSEQTSCSLFVSRKSEEIRRRELLDERSLEREKVKLL